MKRPHANEARQTPQTLLRAHDTHCPFCPGNEARLPRILAETAGEGFLPWLTRVIPNKFPLLGSQDSSPPPPPTPGSSVHEVIIETSRHDADLADLSLVEMQSVIAAWHRRFAIAVARPEVSTAMLFRNHGPAAGASLRHSHSQLVALPTTPPRQVQALAWGQAHHEDHGACVVCTEIAIERDADTRVVEKSAEFVVLVPYAANHPFEQWVVPLRHMPSFLHADEEERTELAGVVQRSVRRLEQVAPGTDYNLCLEPGSLDPAHAVSAHWALRIAPRLTTPGGFEMLTGMAVNPASPEDNAVQLRACR